jgi:hypothetical protein
MTAALFKKQSNTEYLGIIFRNRLFIHFIIFHKNIIKNNSNANKNDFHFYRKTLP